MDFIKKNEGSFFHKCLSTLVLEILKVKGVIQGKNVNISICLYDKGNYITIDIANQLSIREPSRIVKKNFFGKKQYESKY